MVSSIFIYTSKFLGHFSKTQDTFLTTIKGKLESNLKFPNSDQAQGRI